MPDDPTQRESHDGADATTVAVWHELERIIGPSRPDELPLTIQGLLPLASSDEVLALLQSIPTSIGVAGLHAAVRAHFRLDEPLSDA